MNFIAFDIVSISTELLSLIGYYGIIIVVMFGILHPLIENPLSLLNLTLAIALVGIPLGFLIVFLSNIIGILLLYYFAYKFNEKSNDILFEKKTSEKVLNWINNTKTWKHIVVIGMPFVPTYIIKISVPISKVGFKEYLVTLIGAYVFLYFGNFLIYFGVLGFITDVIPTFVSVILLSLFVILIYFGNNLFKKNKIYD